MSEDIQPPSHRALLERIESSIYYRFWFYSWMFKDVARGSMWERAAADRHNREQAYWLPIYMRRWSVMMVLLLGMAVTTECVLLSPVLSAFFYVPSIMTVPYNVVTFIAWAFLRREH